MMNPSWFGKTMSINSRMIDNLKVVQKWAQGTERNEIPGESSANCKLFTLRNIFGPEKSSRGLSRE